MEERGRKVEDASWEQPGPGREWLREERRLPSALISVVEVKDRQCGQSPASESARREPPTGERLLQEPVCARVREPGLETLGSGVVPTSVKRGHQSRLHRVM